MTTANINLWSKTASSNASADPSAPWPEGMLPAQVNDSSRGLMQGTANDRDDTRGALTTAGTLTAYTLTTNSTNTTYQDGLEVCVVFHTATGSSPTLNVDSIGAKPIYKVGSSGPVVLASNDYVQDAHCVMQYDASLNSAAGAWVAMTPLSAASAGGGATQTYFIGGTSTNSTNAYTLATLSGFSQTNGYTLSFKPNAANTGASTLAITSPSLSATNIFKSAVSGPIALTGGELQTNQTATLVYDGTRYILQTPSAGSASLLDTGTSANQVVKLDGSAKLPAVDGSQLTGLTAAVGVLVNVQVITSTGTYTPTAGATKGVAIIIGGGGGGGGAGSTANTAGAGGGSGAITIAYLSSLTSTSITIGSGGSAGGTTGTTGSVGGNGGQTSFGSITAPGGTGGARAGATGGNPAVGGAGGAAGTGGTLQTPGTAGTSSSAGGTLSLGGTGGPLSPYGAGGQSGASGNGGNGGGFGGGGGGASSVNNTGGTGAAGVVIIYEYK